MDRLASFSSEGDAMKRFDKSRGRGTSGGGRGTSGGGRGTSGHGKGYDASSSRGGNETDAQKVHRIKKEFAEKNRQDNRDRLLGQNDKPDVSRETKDTKGNVPTMMQLKENIKPLPSHRYCIGANNGVVNLGLQAIADGEVALVDLAGGQASCLGSTIPKGMDEIPLGIPGVNNLFSNQAYQIRALEDRVKDFANKDNVSMQWIVLTSESTDAMTKTFMKKLAEDFSFEEGKIKFVKQSDIPCTDMKDQPIKDGDRNMTFLNGNGGFFEAIQSLLPELPSKGIKYFHVYCVDNILCRIDDPAFIGQCIANKADCAAKVVEKSDLHEKIGIIGVEAKKQPELLDVIPDDVVERYNALEQDPKLKDKSVCVIEYSEISKEQAEKRDREDPDKLHFRAGNIAIHFFYIDFLSYVSYIKLPYHIALKNIKHKSAEGQNVITPGKKIGTFYF